MTSSKPPTAFRRLSVITAHRPDLVLLDLVMPRLNGLAVLERLRRGDPHLPVLVMTARGELEDRVQGLDAGADDYLVKLSSWQSWRHGFGPCFASPCRLGFRT